MGRTNTAQPSVVVGDFRSFFDRTEAPLRHALTAAFGPQTGREATAEALAYGWEHWDRIRSMENPAGYIFVVGRNAGRRMNRFRRPAVTDPPDNHEPWVEPGLARALARLPERQRTVVGLVHGYGYTLAEAARTLGITKSTAQNHVERAMKRLRRSLGVER